MSDEANRMVRDLGRAIERAVRDHGAVEVVGAIRNSLDGLDAGGAGCSCGGGSGGRANEVEWRRPRSASYETAGAYQEALQHWREWRSTRSGPATERGRPPAVLLRSSNDG